SHNSCGSQSRGRRAREVSVSNVRIRPLVAATLVAVLLAAFARHSARAQTFTPVASPDIAAHVSFALGASWADFDGDGDLDLYVVTGFAANNDNVLYRNDAGTLVRVL